MNVEIRRCTADDLSDVIQFIDQYWESGHPLATCRPLLDWQHRDLDGRGYSFVVARRRQDEAVLGILGFISTKRFDATLADDNVIWLTTWKVRDDAGVGSLGLALLKHLSSTEPHVAIGTIGLNPATLPLYRGLRYHVDELQHYVCVNHAVEAFTIASMVHRPWRQDSGTAAPLDARRLTADQLDDFSRVPRRVGVPRKTAAYFRSRYAAHPVYEYVLLGLLDGGEPTGIIAARTAVHGGAKALRIVDFLGSDDVFARSGPAVQTLLRDLDAEYADVYNAGIDACVFEAAGFQRVDPGGLDIVPDHFEPFERRNVRLWYSLKGSSNPLLFKGDADQDRPNRVPHSAP